jgi:hypothetical protein
LRAIGFAIALIAFTARGGGLGLAEEKAESFRLLINDNFAVKWRLPSGPLPTHVTYAFVAKPIEANGERNCGKMLSAEAGLKPSGIDPNTFAREVRRAFDLWQRVANIEFTEIADQSKAGILIGAQGIPNGRAFTNVSSRDQDGRPSNWITQARICFNPTVRWKVGFDGNLDVYDLRYTIAHEIGHAIGLDHPGPSGQVMGFRYDERQRNLQSGDISGAVVLYGPRMAEGTNRPGSSRVSRSASSQVLAPADVPGGQAFGLGEKVENGKAP